jgi:SNF2 family DNA or RNA helicase
VEKRKPRFQGWLSSDEEEIERRRLRGAEEPMRIVSLESEYPFFGSYEVSSRSEVNYTVEIRSLTELTNSCDCADYRVNGLGTCKHIEAALLHLQKDKKRQFREASVEGSPRIEIFLDPGAEQIRITWPRDASPSLRDRLLPYFSADQRLLTDPLTALPSLRRELEKLPAESRSMIRLSRHLPAWEQPLKRQRDKLGARDRFMQDVQQGKRTLELVKLPLYPYQRDGMLHLAFVERALLADEMGLGKTVQAIAACELLRRLHGIQRVLVISPASLKAEWEEQIDKFTGLSALIVQGARPNRLMQYRQPAFFYLCNYEQILIDAEDIQTTLAPDVIVLDEAQRIKNWQTKTANAVKRLRSRYAFVLSGTPLENRIDEVYSIVQFLDPQLFGPLFRFNRDFYELDARGKPVGYKNLDELHRRLRPIMLRRRKEEVEGDLPGCTINTYFVGMDAEQQSRYEEYSLRVARLLSQARRRPLLKEEFEKLQKWLACMRMLCDTPYILDPECRLSPKLRELETILEEQLEEPDAKIIIFSEWQRMLELVRELAESMRLEIAWHTGEVPQQQRRVEIRRFKDSPECRLFLSTESGGLGLNLQNANVVINLDLPWNPARLEQRIARAWRKHQTRTVQVINLVCEHSIEHRMMQLLSQKKVLAEGVLDGENLKSMELPSGRAAFMERLEGLMGTVVTQPQATEPATPEDPVTQLKQDAVARWHDRLDLMEVHGHEQKTVLTVMDRPDKTIESDLQRMLGEHFQGQNARLEVMDRATYETIQRLIDAGVLSLNAEPETLHRSPNLAAKRADEQERRLREAQQHFSQAEHQRRMAKVLADGGFAVEALHALTEALEIALRSLALWLREDHADEPLPLNFIESRLVPEDLVPSNTLALVAQMREHAGDQDETQTRRLLAQGETIIEHSAQALERLALQ